VRMAEHGQLRIRPAARAVVLDPDDRILLVRFEFPGGRTIWATPGGGIEPGEGPEQAIRRELAEEAGLVVERVGPAIWTRLHIVPFIGGQWDGQREQYHLVRVPSFTAEPQLSWERLNAEHVFELRWWSSAELDEAAEIFAPRRLPELLRALLSDGPPSEPIDTGV
jgi:8-oxo-dGTP pyrophosphatase MutT (NUDIX family)